MNSFDRARKPADLADSRTAQRILVVDDEMIVRRTLARYLQLEGFESEEAADGESALTRLAADGPWDVLFTDLDMPGMGGLALVAEARRRDPCLAIAVVTGNSERQTPVEALRNGAWSWLAKPFDRDEIRTLLLSVLERRRLVVRELEEHDRLEAEVRRRTRELRERELELAQRLVAATSVRDEETGDHIRRIGIVSARLGQRLGWGREATEDLRVAAMMHDIGKIGIPDGILRKPGRLTREEYEAMKRHTTLGARVLDGSDVPMLRLAREIALHHHERWDGKGYPTGLAGERIPESARIVSIVDCFDALTHDRVYRAAMSVEEALGILRSDRGTAFDPGILDVFLAHHEVLTAEDAEIEETGRVEIGLPLAEPQRSLAAAV